MNRAMKKRVSMVVWGLVLLLSSCKHPVNIQESSVEKRFLVPSLDSRAFQEQEAKCADMPILLDAIALPEESERGALSYLSTLSAEQIADFYCTQMEHYGWKLVCCYVRHRMLVFEKPHTIGIIKIKPLSEHKTRFIIFRTKVHY
jgi:hypothetical protein